MSFLAQFVGTLMGVSWPSPAAWLSTARSARSPSLRLTPEEEYEGADLSIHKIGATPDREASW